MSEQKLALLARNKRKAKREGCGRFYKLASDHRAMKRKIKALSLPKEDAK